MRILKRLGGVMMIISSCMASVSCIQHYALSPAAVQARGLKPGEGYIVATFHEGTFNAVTGKMFREGSAQASIGITGPTKDDYVSLRPAVSGPGEKPWVTSATPSEVLAVPVPAGNYAVSSWNMIGQALTTTVSVRNRLPFKAPFEVKPGQATYIGQVNALSLVGKNFIGVPVFSRGMVIVRDEFDKDQSRIAKTYPTIRKETIRRSNVPAAYQKEMHRIADTPDDSIWKKLLN